MYGMVLMVAATGSGDATGFGKRNNGCDGGCTGVVAPAGSGCHGAPAGCDGGCSGRGGFFGLRSGGRSGGCAGCSGGCAGYSGCGGFAGGGCSGVPAHGGYGSAGPAPVVVIPAAGGTVSGAAAADVRQPLWDRLGGEKVVRAVVRDLVVAAGTDPKVNFTRDGKYKLDLTGVVRLQQLLVEYISSLSGGPLAYTGREMKPLHAGMKITDAQFDAVTGHLAAALKKSNVPQAEADELVALVAATKPDIVEVK